MKTLGKILVILITLGLLGLTIYFWYQTYQLKNSPVLSDTVYQTDTVYLPAKDFKPEKEYPNQVKPKEILVYVTDTDRAINDTIPIYQPPFTDQDSLFQILLEKSKLQLSMINTETGTYSTRSYPINLEDYTYNWYQGELTSKYIGKKVKVEPYAYAKYRIKNNLLDLGSGISFKTKRLNYNLGINIFSYPKLGKDFGWDLEVGIRYNF